MIEHFSVMFLPLKMLYKFIDKKSICYVIYVLSNSIDIYRKIEKFLSDQTYIKKPIYNLPLFFHIGSETLSDHTYINNKKKKAWSLRMTR